MSLEQRVHETLKGVPDPEMPISIVDLGLVESVRLDGSSVHIDILPTFVGCPALDMIKGDIVAKVSQLDGVDDVHVEFLYDPPWSVERITDEGRASLKAHGVTVPDRGGRLEVPGHREGGVEVRTSALPCPFCGSRSTYLDSKFGPTRCRMICYCDACGNSFEHMKRV